MALQALLVNKHPSRRCLCTVQHRRDCSRQFCKTLCNVLLCSQLSFERSVLIRQSAHLLLQCSQRIIHLRMFGSSTTLSRVGSHASAKGFGGQGQTGIPCGCFYVTSRHDHQRVPHSFRDSQLSVAITREQARHAPRCQSTTNKEQERTEQRFATMIAVYLLCVLCAKYDLLLDTNSSVCYAENKCTAQV